MDEEERRHPPPARLGLEPQGLVEAVAGAASQAMEHGDELERFHAGGEGKADLVRRKAPAAIGARPASMDANLLTLGA
jgi:hypothetical protein